MEPELRQRKPQKAKFGSVIGGILIACICEYIHAYMLRAYILAYVYTPIYIYPGQVLAGVPTWHLLRIARQLPSNKHLNPIMNKCMSYAYLQVSSSMYACT